MVLRFLVAVVLVLVTAGCGMSLPSDEQDWTRTSVQALEDMAGNVSTARMAVDQERHGRLLGRAALVIAQEAEDSGLSTVRGYGREQPPASRTEDFEELNALLGEAQAALRMARVAVAADREDEYGDVQSMLTDIGEEIETAAQPLREAAP